MWRVYLRKYTEHWIPTKIPTNVLPVEEMWDKSRLFTHAQCSALGLEHHNWNTCIVLDIFPILILCKYPNEICDIRFNKRRMKGWRMIITALVCHHKHKVYNFTTNPRYLIRRVSSPQVGGCADRVHEEQGVGQVFPRAPGISETLLAPGLLPAQASAEDPQVPPTAACKSHEQLLFTHTKMQAWDTGQHTDG